MKFKHWKEAEKREMELKESIDKENGDIKTMETEARSEDIEVEKRDILIKDIETKVESRKKLQEEYDEAVREKEKLKNTEERQFGMIDNLSKNRIEERNNNMDEEENVYGTLEYRNAWIESVKIGDKSIVSRFLNTATAADGGAVVPTELAEKLNDALMQGGRILHLCNVSTIKAVLEEPIVDTKTDPEVHKETDESKKKEKQVKLGVIKLDPEYISEILPVTKKFESLSNDAFWEWLLRELPDALLRTMDTLILSSDQTGGIKGIMTNTNVKLVIVIDATLDFNTGNKAVAELDDGSEENTTVIMNRKTYFSNILGMTDTTGKPIYKILTDNAGKPKYFYSGFPVKFNSSVKSYNEAVAGDIYMVVGDFQAFRVNLPNGLEPEITRDALTRKDEGIVEYSNDILAAGDVAKMKAFTLVKKV